MRLSHNIPDDRIEEVHTVTGGHWSRLMGDSFRKDIACGFIIASNKKLEQVDLIAAEHIVFIRLAPRKEAETGAKNGES